MVVVLLTTKNLHLSFSPRMDHQVLPDHPLVPEELHKTQSNLLRLLRPSSPVEVEEESSVLLDNSKLWMMITPNL
jgi:hypothetical protein